MSAGIAYAPPTNQYYITGSLGIGFKEQAVAYLRGESGTPGPSVSINGAAAFGLGVTAEGYLADGPTYGGGGGFLFGEGAGFSVNFNGALPIG